MSENELSKLPESMRSEVSSMQVGSEKSLYSLRVRLSGRSKDLEMSYLARQGVLEQDRRSWKISRSGTFKHKKGDVLNIDAEKLLLHQCFQDEKLLQPEKSSPADLKSFFPSTTAFAIRCRGLTPMYPDSRLSSTEEVLHLTPAQRRVDTVHIAADFESGTKIFFTSINVKQKKVLRSQIVNLMPELENSQPYKVRGLIWDLHQNSAIVMVWNTEKNEDIILEVKQINDSIHRSTKVLYRRIITEYWFEEDYFFKNDLRDWFEYPREVFNQLTKTLRIDPKTGLLENGILFSQSFEPLVEAIQLKLFKKKTNDDVMTSIPLKGSSGLVLLASEKSVYLYDIQNHRLFWEMPFKHHIVKGLVSHKKIASIDSKRHILNIFGVNEDSGLFARVKTINLRDFFENRKEPKTDFKYSRLLEFFYLKEESQYLIAVEQISLDKLPKSSNPGVGEEILISQNLLNKSRETPKGTMLKPLVVLKLKKSLEIVQKQAFSYLESERLTTSILGRYLSVLRQGLVLDAQTGKAESKNITLEFINTKNLQKAQTSSQAGYIFKFKSDDIISRFLFTKQGNLVLFTTKIDQVNKIYEIEAHAVEFRHDRFGLDEIHEEREYFEKKVALYCVQLQIIPNEIFEKEAKIEKKEEEKGEKGLGPKKSTNKGGRTKKGAPGSRKMKDANQKSTRKKGTVKTLFTKDRRSKKATKKSQKLFEGVTVLSAVNYQSELFDNGARSLVDEHSGESQSPSGWMSVPKPVLPSKGMPLHLNYWSNRLNKMKQKTYQSYLKRAMEQKKGYLNDHYVTLSELYALDEHRFVIQEYLTPKPYTRQTRSIGGIEDRKTNNTKFELARDGMFRFAFLDVRNSKVNRFKLKAQNLVLTRMMVWERQLRGGEQMDSGEGVVVADFDENMNLVLFDLSPLFD